MKYLTALLVMAGMMIHPMVLADDAVSMQQSADAGTATESNASAVADLCNTYAKEDGVAADKKAGYLNACLNSMTDLSEGIQEDLPLVAEDSGEAVAAPSSEQVNRNSPEKLVQGELVETPDPAAEQLNAGK
ncbi:hypothetical protein VSS37_21330 [Candidatus Thiothrix sp. Deng01]|uniref:Uncharacterized protein n=1 Tax=Candidatus Thiothrix phosphatis TaxID=3112415 RepID=A0ABU6D381_9GAMM|nr:hypothetical protein [Candidatus Thiothrix sp. Deng01]MEB4593534.1 hypothetical protein [Candidatus Thiothrix sp. Deng01]